MDNGMVRVSFSNPGGEVVGINYGGIDNLLESRNEISNRGFVRLFCVHIAVDPSHMFMLFLFLCINIIWVSGTWMWCGIGQDNAVNMTGDPHQYIFSLGFLDQVNKVCIIFLMGS